MIGTDHRPMAEARVARRQTGVLKERPSLNGLCCAELSAMSRAQTVLVLGLGNTNAGGRAFASLPIPSPGRAAIFTLVVHSLIRIESTVQTGTEATPSDQCDRRYRRSSGAARSRLRTGSSRIATTRALSRIFGRKPASAFRQSYLGPKPPSRQRAPRKLSVRRLCRRRGSRDPRTGSLAS